MTTSIITHLSYTDSIRAALLRLTKRVQRRLQPRNRGTLIPIADAVKESAGLLGELEERLSRGVAPELVAADLRIISNYLREIS